MLKITLLLALGAVCAVHGARFEENRTANMEFLHKQKKIYDLLLYVNQGDLIDAEFYETGRNYNLESNIDMYKDKYAAQKFIWWYKQGSLLSRDAIFSMYNQEQLYEMQQLFELLYSAKDFQTFYKTACWARLNLNNGVFVSAFTVAVMYREDCKYMILPAIYEIYPNLFYSSNVIQDAQNIKMSKAFSGAPAIGNVESYTIYANYSRAYMPYIDSEYKMDYFMEDPSLNAYYYYIRQMNPFWMSSKYGSISQEVRGRIYYYVHQQLMARYYLERMSNDLGKIEDFDWYKPIYPGFFSTLTYANGVPVPQRNKYSSIPFYKYKYLKDVMALEMRIMDAVDSGYLLDEEGKRINIYTPEGLYLLANVIEGNMDSCNRRFYGMYDALARDILGFSFNQQNKNKQIPSALQCNAMNMRDPSFYMLYKRIMSYFLRYKRNQRMYSQSELVLPGVKFDSVNVDKLTTYFDYCETLINNAIAVENFNRGKSLRLKARRLCLNYKPFSYKFNINSDKEMKAMLKIFLGPDYRDVEQDYVYLKKYYYQFVEMDRFIVNLRPGANNIERQSSESMLTMPDMMPMNMFLEKLNKAISGSAPFMYSNRQFGFSERLTLPKGKPEGMKYKMFFFLSPVDEGSMRENEYPMFGKILTDGRAPGFPLDRPMYAWNYTIPNMAFKDVMIYNLVE
ncbi:hexamerin 70c [Nomia melanderi]|uniref:hexamerin 70c n=1 Tax=Nomia melanderi TaxID=2448451 RepID=UPI0013043525|nr:arylphorin subunit alpha-like [Nomia melanderi]